MKKLKQVLYTIDETKINWLVDQLEWEFTNTLSIKTAHITIQCRTLSTYIKKKNEVFALSGMSKFRNDSGKGSVLSSEPFIFCFQLLQLLENINSSVSSKYFLAQVATLIISLFLFVDWPRHLFYLNSLHRQKNKIHNYLEFLFHLWQFSLHSPPFTFFRFR